MNGVENRVVAAIENSDIGFRTGMRTTYHWWLNEYDKRTLTVAERAAVRRLLAQGRAYQEHAAGAHGRGVIQMRTVAERTDVPNMEAGNE